MRTPAREHTRTERLREHAAAADRARQVAAAMGPLVRGREARAQPGEPPLEVEFAALDVDGRGLPAAVWVALRRDDVDAALDAMTAASQTEFLIEERDEMGDGYRLHSVAETLPVPESELLLALLGRALDVPPDVLTVLADWGPADPRSAAEIDDLLTSRFGPARRTVTPRTQPRGEVEPAAAVDGRLAMTVDEVAQVLRLSDAQIGALTVLVRNAAVTLTLR